MQIQSQGLPFDKYLEMTNMDVDSLLEQAKEPAARQVKMDLAVGAIIKAEGLEGHRRGRGRRVREDGQAVRHGGRGD